MNDIPIIGSFFPKSQPSTPPPVVLPAPTPPVPQPNADPAAAAARAQALSAAAKAKGRQSTLFTPGGGAGDTSKATTSTGPLFSVKSRPGD